MLDRLLHALIGSRNEAADDVLLEALRVGNESEQRTVLDAMIRRKTSRSLCGVIARFPALPEPLQQLVLSQVKLFHHALTECGRSPEKEMRLAAMSLIAISRQGKLAYVLSENLHDPDETLSKAATEAIVALARWVAVETRRLQAGHARAPAGNKIAPDPIFVPMVGGHKIAPDPIFDPGDGLQGIADSYGELQVQRPEIEAAVARALNLHRGKHGQDLLRAALLLADWSGSKTLAILHTAKHGGQSQLVRKLQQPPAAEHVEAFLLGASHGQLRSHFGVAFSHIDQAPVLDAILRKTHWLKDHQLQLCMHQVTRGAWWGKAELSRDVGRRSPGEAAKIAEWLAASGVHDVEQDDRMQVLLAHAQDDFDARLRLLRIAMRRKRGASVNLIRAFVYDPDERLVRMAAREIVRRKPLEFENILLKLMTTATPSVRRVIGRAIGQAGFEQYWQRFDRLDKSTRRQAGRAMFKLLPDALQRLQRRLTSGSVEQRVKAMQMAQELGLADALRSTLVTLCSDPNPRLRSKAVSVIGYVPSVPSEVLVERLVNDTDPRVRANAIEVLESREDPQFVPVLAERALGSTPRERANAIKAMHRMKVSTASSQLLNMLRDDRPEHRISALWALRQIGWWQLLNEVGRIAKDDGNLRVRRYALGVLKTVAELLKAQKKTG